MRPLITVVITTYNYGRFIEECIDSVLAQDYPAERMDIVVVDDGSTDDTPERVRKYGTKIRYLRKENGGQASALNLGFANARGEIVSLLDADDIFVSNKLKRVAEEFARDPVLGMFYHPFLEWDMETNQRRESQFPLVSGSALQSPEKFLDYAGPGTCVSFRRKFLERLLPIPEEIRMLADGYLGGLIVFVAPILSTPECLAIYRFHDKNAFHTDESQMPVETRRRRLQMFRVEIAAMCRWLRDNDYTREEPAVRFFLDRWKHYQQRQEFLMEPPGRLRFFRNLLLYNRFYGPYMSRRLRIINHMNAWASLLTGYRHFAVLDKWRLSATEFLRQRTRMRG